MVDDEEFDPVKFSQWDGFEWDEQDILADQEVDVMEDRAWLGFLGESYYRHHADEGLRL